MNKMLILVIIIALLIFGLLIYHDTKRVDKYWECQTEISSSDSINMLVSETKHLRGFLSFNRKLYLSGAKLFRPDIELWEVPSLELPFTIRKKGSSDTLHILEYGYYFVFRKDETNNE